MHCIINDYYCREVSLDNLEGIIQKRVIMKDDAQDKRNLFNLRVIPWWTDGCSDFFNNVFKWFPNLLGRQLTCLEFGGGNSTFYMLGKGVKIATVESDDEYIRFICNVSRNIGYRSTVVSPNEFNAQLFKEFHLVIIKAGDVSDTDNIIDKAGWDLIINDGISRREVLQEIRAKSKNAVVILDNVEYCANWGRLDRTSAKPDLIEVYRSILRDHNWKHYLFEQNEGREGRGSPDKCGWESPHRWISAVLWPESHLFTKLMVSNIGMPLVNELGVDDTDIATLKDRCPFDWKLMEWKKQSFPVELDLKLNRTYD